MQPKKLVVFSDGIEVSLFELLEGSLGERERKETWVISPRYLSVDTYIHTYIQWVNTYIQWVDTSTVTHLCVYSELDFLLFTEGIRDVYHQTSVRLEIYRLCTLKEYYRIMEH